MMAEKNTGSKISSILLDNIVSIIFIVFIGFGYFASDIAVSTFANELTSRFFRNAILVMSLIIPVMAGLGLNFGIVVGALAGMLSLILVRYHYTLFIGFPGLLAAFAIATPIALLFGFLTGKLYNKTRGQEMVASLIVGYFATAVYMIIVLFVIGGIIPTTPGHSMMNPGDAVGVAHTFDLGLPAGEITARHGDMLPGIARSMNQLWQVDFLHALIAVAAALIVFLVIRRLLQQRNPALGSQKLWVFCVQLGICVALLAFAIYSAYLLNHWQRVLEVTREHTGDNLIRLNELVGIPRFLVEVNSMNPVPAITALVIAAVGLFTLYFARTKLGQDCRAVGQNQQIANVAGIDVDKTRIIATMISTMFASWGMIIFLHDMGHVSTYTAHQTIGFFSVAAILVGGATVARASVKNAMIGLLLFHSMVSFSPAVGRFFSDDGNIGEYLRSLMVFGSIGLSLGLYVWKNNKAAKAKERLDLREVSLIDRLKAERLEREQNM